MNLGRVGCFGCNLVTEFDDKHYSFDVTLNDMVVCRGCGHTDYDYRVVGDDE